MKLWSKTVAFFKYWWNQWFGKSQSTKTLPPKLKSNNIYDAPEDSWGVRSFRDFSLDKYDKYKNCSEPADNLFKGSSWTRVKTKEDMNFAIAPTDPRIDTEIQKRAKKMSNEEFRKMFLSNTSNITTWKAKPNGNSGTK